ncbi:MAG: hypothetical protein ABI653_05435 [Bacteroidota bacterium]
MEIFITIFYCIFFTWLVIYTKFFVASGLGKWFLAGLFIIKLLAAFAYGIYFSQPAALATSDSWNYFQLSKGETDWLLQDPLAFIKDIFTSGYHHSSNLFLQGNSYWNDLKSNVIIKLMAICNLFTFKNYYANAVLLNYIYFFGPMAVYRVFSPTIQKNIPAAIAVFCIPSFLFWCSGAHKDGLIFTCIGLIIYFFYTQLKNRKIYYVHAIYMLILLIIIFALRNFLAFLLLPALLVWVLSDFYPKKKWLIIFAIYGTGIVLFFVTGFLKEANNFPEYIVKKQTEFKVLGGGSQIDLPALQPNALSYVKFLPYAIDVSFLRPHFSEGKNVAAIFSTIELCVLWLIVILALFRWRKNPAFNSSFFVFCCCFSISVLLLCGFTVTLSGAITRYRSIVLPLIITPFLLGLFLKKGEI